MGMMASERDAYEGDGDACLSDASSVNTHVMTLLQQHMGEIFMTNRFDPDK